VLLQVHMAIVAAYVEPSVDGDLSSLRQQWNSALAAEGRRRTLHCMADRKGSPAAAPAILQRGLVVLDESRLDIRPALNRVPGVPWGTQRPSVGRATAANQYGGALEGTLSEARVRRPCAAAPR
jgi:hypothetical protein